MKIRVNCQVLKQTVLLFLAFPLSFIYAHAGQIDVEYKSFYSHVKKLEKEDTQGLQFSFGFININSGNLCSIEKASIITQKQTIPLSVTKEQRFTVPSEKALKLANAIVNITFVEPANQCDMSVQLETKPQLLKSRYTKLELQNIYQQYDAFFNEMGSFLSFLMPTMQGLIIYFDDESMYKQLANGLTVQNGMIMLVEEDIQSVTTLNLPTSPLRITALAKK